VSAVTVVWLLMLVPTLVLLTRPKPS